MCVGVLGGQKRCQVAWSWDYRQLQVVTCQFWELNLSLLEAQWYMLLTAELLLQPQNVVFS